MDKDRQKKKRRADLLLLAALLLLSGALFLWQRSARTGGNTAAVYADGELLAAYPLDRDARVPIDTAAGHNLLVIENGAADMIEADCPDRICVGMHPIRYVGETIVCLPHRLLVQIEGPGEREVDVP